MEFLQKHGQLIIMIFLAILFVQNCSNKSAINATKKSVEKTTGRLDSTIKTLPKQTLTKSDVQSISENTMYKFLIFEEDVDKGKMSLSEIQLKLEKTQKDTL